MKKNIVVLVSGGGTNLQALIDAEKSGEIKNGKITCVISGNPNAYALTRAEQSNINKKVISKKDFDTFEEYDMALTKALKEEKADLIVLAGFMTILGDNVINTFKNKIINIHPALIPSFSGKGYYGLSVHKAALEKGVKVSGATAHFVTSGCDEGPIILQKAVEVLNDDIPETLQKRIMEQVEWKILPKAVSLFCEEKIVIEGSITKIL